MLDFLFYFAACLVLAGLVVAGVLMVRGYMSGQSPSAALFGPRPDRRLDVVEHASVDGKRRLILIRRDDVEHLIMTGGPVDVLIETGIQPTRVRAPQAVDGSLQQPVFQRSPRAFGQASGDH